MNRAISSGAERSASALKSRYAGRCWPGTGRPSLKPVARRRKRRRPSSTRGGTEEVNHPRSGGDSIAWKRGWSHGNQRDTETVTPSGTETQSSLSVRVFVDQSAESRAANNPAHRQQSRARSIPLGGRSLESDRSMLPVLLVMGGVIAHDTARGVVVLGPGPSQGTPIEPSPPSVRRERSPWALGSGWR